MSPKVLDNTKSTNCSRESVKKQKSREFSNLIAVDNNEIKFNTQVQKEKSSGIREVPVMERILKQKSPTNEDQPRLLTTPQVSSCAGLTPLPPGILKRVLR